MALDWWNLSTVQILLQLQCWENYIVANLDKAGKLASFEWNPKMSCFYRERFRKTKCAGERTQISACSGGALFRNLRWRWERIAKGVWAQLRGMFYCTGVCIWTLSPGVGHKSMVELSCFSLPVCRVAVWKFLSPGNKMVGSFCI